MITCNNCGAKYDDNLDCCPYCEGDNFDKSVRKHENIIHNLEKEKKRWESMPDRMAKNGTSLAKLIILYFAVGVVVVCCLAFVITRITSQVSYNKKAARLEELEAMYQEKNYSEICHYIDNLESRYDSGYEEYVKVANMQRNIEEYIQDEDEQYIEWIIENKESDALSNISYLVCIFEECQDSEDQYYKYNEQDAVEYYRNYCYGFLEEHYGLPKEVTKVCLSEAGGVRRDNKDEVTIRLQKNALECLNEKQR